MSTHSFLKGPLQCSYCNEPFAHDRYTIETPNGQQVASCCSKECRRAFNRWILGDSEWVIRDIQYAKQDGRRVFYPPTPDIVSDARKTSREQWLPTTRKKLTDEERAMAEKELVTKGEFADTRFI